MKVRSTACNSSAFPVTVALGAGFQSVALHHWPQPADMGEGLTSIHSDRAAKPLSVTSFCLSVKVPSATDPR
jgi:hypothetical protein